MRLLFINPVHLPALTESYLRDDFFFAMYLTYCLGKVQTRFFQWTIFTILMIFICFLTFSSMFAPVQEAAKIYLRFFMVLSLWMLVQLMQSSVKKSYNKVTPSIFKNE